MQITQQIKQPPKNLAGQKMGFIGLGCYDHRDGLNQPSKGWKLDEGNPLYLSFGMKDHTMIIASAGSGKSFLAGVLAEENIATLQNSAICLFDRMGIFSTLDLAGDQNIITDWNGQLKEGYYHVKAQGMQGVKIWIPLCKKDQFEPDMYYRTYSIKPSELSLYSFCYTFGLKTTTEPQANLFRISQKELKKKNENFELAEWYEYLSDNGESLGYKPQTIDALKQKLGALNEMGILSTESPKLSEMFKKGSVTVVDVSQMDEKTARIIVNFMMESLIRKRDNICGKLVVAKRRNIKVNIPDFIPAVHIIVDEAKNFITGSEVFSKGIKEGRNIGIKITAISQSPDLIEDLYSNISHLFIGLMNFDKDINYLRGILPFNENPSFFKSQIKTLDRGCFMYYNLKEKTKIRIKVRPRKTLHVANTEIEDEEIYLTDVPVKHQNPVIEDSLDSNEIFDPSKSNPEIEEIEEMSPKQIEIKQQRDMEKLGWDPKDDEKRDQTFEKQFEKMLQSENPEIKVAVKIQKSQDQKPVEKVSEVKSTSQINSSDVDEDKQIDVLLFSHFYSKFTYPIFSTIRRYDKNFQENQERKVFLKKYGIIGNIRIKMKSKKKLRDIPDIFLINDTDRKSREEAIKLLNSFYQKPISEDEEVIIIRLEWINQSNNYTIAKAEYFAQNH